MSDIAVQIHTTDMRGDHETDVVIAIELDPAETLYSLANRVLIRDARWGKQYCDHIEIRLVRPSESEGE